MLNRRVAAILVGVLSAAVLFSFIIFSQQQAEERRLDAEVLARLRAISIAASDGNLTVEDANDLWSRAGGEVLGSVSRLQIPVVITDSSGTPTSYSELPEDFPRGPDGAYDDTALRAFAEELDEIRPHFETPTGQVHFGDPEFLRRLRWIPWLQAGSLLAIVGGGGWLLFTSFRSERERIWSAMARESAHQMGTPLSSLVGWLEVLETTERPAAEELGQPDLIDEMAADVRRLQKVSRRFELIGRRPKLEPVSMRVTADHMRQYFEARLPTLGSGKVAIDVKIEPDAPRVLGNGTLLEWALENLMKNAMDALAPDGGRIVISHLGPNGRRSVYRVRDTGPGVPAGIRERIFDIGVSTKERGWGVGLSLVKRIVEEMHGGSIQLEDTPRGASFRIELPRHRDRKRKA